METERLLKRHFLPELGSRTLQDISTSDLLRITDDMLATPTRSQSRLHRRPHPVPMGDDEALHPAQPHGGLKIARQSAPRSRVLTPSELRIAFTAAQQRAIYGQIIRLLILTGQRVGQITSLRPEFIGEDTITWPAAHMKGNREHTIPIGPLDQSGA